MLRIRVPVEFQAQALVARLLEQVAGTSSLWPRADRGREVRIDELRRAGASVHAAVVNCQNDVPEPAPGVHEAIRRRKLDGVLVSSSNLAPARLSEPELAEIVRGRVGMISISPVTGALREAGCEPAAEAVVDTIDGLMAALLAARARRRKR